MRRAARTFSSRELAAKLIELARMYNEALLVVERNNHGYGVLAHLRAENATNVYQEGGQDGWVTSAVSRPAMLENFAAVLATEPGLFRSPRLLNECRTFVRQTDGSSGAATGTHDDCVMAMAIALGARQKTAGRISRGTLEVASLELTGGIKKVSGNVYASQRECLRGRMGGFCGMSKISRTLRRNGVGARSGAPGAWPRPTVLGGAAGSQITQVLLDCGGAACATNAGRSTRTLDALLGWTFLRGEVPK